MLALALNRKTRTAAVLRTIYFSSSVLSVTIVTLIWRIVFIGNFGLLATIYGWFGATLSCLPLRSQSGNDRHCHRHHLVVHRSADDALSFGAAAGPGEIYEAAALDNASRWRTLWYITLPSIRRTFVARRSSSRSCCSSSCSARPS
jgi:multiple sugar transport system permease protein